MCACNYDVVPLQSSWNPNITMYSYELITSLLVSLPRLPDLLSPVFRIVPLVYRHLILETLKVCFI